MKKYNSSTGCYKIDLYINGKYATTTEQAKSCKEAVNRYNEKFGETKGLTAHYTKYV